MPKTLARSVIAKAGMPSAAARATASSMRTMPSVMENSLWSRRWTKAGFGIGLRGAGEAKILPPAPPVRTPEFGPGSKTLLGQQDQMGQFARDGGFHDHDQRHSRARPCAGADAFRRGYRRGCSARDLGAAAGGKAERESGQQARLASYPDPAAVQFRDRLDDGETQTRAGRGFLARAAGSIEPIEDARQVLRRDPGAGIGHLDLGRAVAARHRLYGDRAVRSAVAQRVGQKISHRPVEHQ